MKRRSTILALSSAGALALLGALALAAITAAGKETTLGSYGTSLRARARSQAFNALRAARSLDGVVLQPGQTLSFNRRVGPWGVEAGYRKAPASFDGELIRSYGGGVCQTSTTLYNAALLAGLDVVERHRHIRPPAYVAPGRDAAVAMPSIDLRVRNPYAFPVRIQAGGVGESVVIAFRGRGPRRPVKLCTEVETVAPPPTFHGAGTRKSGQPGFTALTYRQDGRQAKVSSHLTYPAVGILAP